MTTDEAYAETLQAVEVIREAGVDVQVTPYSRRDDPELIAKYSGPEHVSHDKWVNVTFRAKTDEQANLIHEKAKKLSWLGIGFDTGGGFGCRDWELDWSFSYTGKSDSDREAARDEVEDMVQSMDDEGCVEPGVHDD